MNSIAQTDFFEARPFNFEDVPLVVSWMSTTPLEVFMLSSSLIFPVLPEMLIKRVQKASSEEHKFYSVFLIEEGIHVGYFEIKNINHRHKTGTGSHIILSPTYRSKGMGKDFVELISTVAFTSLWLDRISLNAHTFNRAAIACYVKAGYSFEGLIREVLLFEGERYSICQMGLLRTEWEKVTKRKI